MYVGVSLMLVGAVLLASAYATPQNDRGPGSGNANLPRASPLLSGH